MGRDDIIRMAREAGASFETAESMFRFAELVSAAEREACAKLAEAEAQRTGEAEAWAEAQLEKVRAQINERKRIKHPKGGAA